jgi:ribosome-associated protein
MAKNESRNIQTVEIREEPIELCQVIKFAGLVGSGGEAKQAIANGLVKVNGVIETRKRNKIYSGFVGFVIEYASTVIRVVVAKV